MCPLTRHLTGTSFSRAELNEKAAYAGRVRTKPVAPQFKRVITFLGHDPSPEPKTLAERVEAKQRSLGVSLAQIARYLGWDPGSLRRYLDGTWRMSPVRQDALEALLNAEDTVLAGLPSLKRRR